MFADYKAGLDPTALQVLQDAFDLAWAEVVAVPGVTFDEPAAREIIARRIVAAWRDHGEHDPEQLKRHALQGFVT